MKRSHWAILIVIALALLLTAAYYLRTPSPPKYPSKYLTSAECTAAGGEVTNYIPPKGDDPYSPAEPVCPENKESLGRLSDLNCPCICCR